jgi:hypothetical protein
MKTKVYSVISLKHTYLLCLISESTQIGKLEKMAAFSFTFFQGTDSDSKGPFIK